MVQDQLETRLVLTVAKSVPIEAPESRAIIINLQQAVLAFPGSKTGQLGRLSGRIRAGNVEGGVCKSLSETE